MISIGIKKIAAAAALVLTSTSLQAATLFTDRSTWESAIGSFQTETFSNDISDSDTITLDNGITSSEVLPGQFFGVNNVTLGSYNGRMGTNTDHPLEIVWDFGETVQGFFADFSAINTNGLSIKGDFDGTGVQTISIYDAIGLDGSFGLISTGAGFSSFSWISGSSGSEYFFVDNFSSTPLSTTTVPLPAALPLLAGGLGFIGFLGWRRKVVAAV